MSSHHRANAFEPALSSGVWEGLSYRQGCEGVDETRWTQTSLVFTDIRKGGVGRLTPRGEAPAWGREEPGSAIFRLCGKGISHWRGRQIHFALRGFVEPGGGGGGADQQLMRITLIKRHLGEYSNVVQYEGTLSQSGSSIQGKFADGLFQLRQVNPASHVLARELTGAWDGESSCRRGGQSNTRWKSVRLVFQPLPPGDGRGWGLLVTGGGDSIWNEQRIPFCISGRLSLPGLEVELEKQHLEGYHNRIAYFGRVLPGGSGDKIMDGPAADDPPPPTRLIGVYEHGDFFLHRNPKADLDSSGRPLPGGSTSSTSNTNRAVGSGGGGSSTTGGRLAGGGRTGEKSVLEACIDLFRRSADNPSVWNKAAGLYRPTLVPPMARSHSGDGLRGGPGTPVMFGQKQQQQQQQQQKGLQAPSSSPSPQQHQHQPAMRVTPTNGGGGRGGEGAGLGQAAGKLVVRKHVGGVAGPSTSYAWRGEEGDEQVDGRVARVDAGPRGSARFGEGGGAGGGGGNDRHHPQQHPPPRGAVTTRTHYPSLLPPMYDPVGRRSSGSSGGGGGGDFDDREGAEGGGLAWDLKAPSQVWEQPQQQQQVYQRPHEPNGSSNSSSNGRPGRSDKASEMQAAAAAWNNLGFGSRDLVGDNGGGGDGGREFRAGMPLPTSDHNGAGGWKGMFDDVTRQAGETAADARSSAVDAVGVMAVSTGGGDVQPLFARAAGTRKTLEFPAMPPAAGGGGGGDWDEAAAVAAFMNSDGGGGRGGGGTGRMAAGDGGGSANGAPQGQSVAANGHGHGAFHYRHTMHQNGGDTSSSSSTSSPSSTSNASSSGSGCNKVVGAPTATAAAAAAAAAAGRTGLDDMQLLRSSLSDSRAGGDDRGAAATAASAASSLHQRDVDNAGAGAGGAFQYSPAKNATDSGAPAPGLAPLATVSSAGTATPAAAAASSGVGDGDDDERSTTRKPADGSGGGGGGCRQEEERCKICHMGSVDALLLPCGHLCACHSCASVLVVCPICRADIYRVQPVYRA